MTSCLAETSSLRSQGGRLNHKAAWPPKDVLLKSQADTHLVWEGKCVLGLGGSEKIYLMIILQIIIIFTVIQNTYLIGIIHDSYSQCKHTDHMAVIASIYHNIYTMKGCRRLS